MFLPLAAQMVPTEEFMFQNVAYKVNVYKTGIPPMYHKKVKYVTFDFFYVEKFGINGENLPEFRWLD